MKRIVPKLLNVAALAAVMISVASCSNDDEEFIDKYPHYKLINFEGTSIPLAGPTSYGENLYYGYTGDDKFTEGEIGVEPGVTLKFGVNKSSYYDAPDFSAGGMVLSKWCYRSNIPTKTGNWWQSYENQCSVYNVSQKDGDTSNTFAVIFGYNSDWCEGPSMSFSNGKEYVIDGMYVCPTSYVYGVIKNGNPMSADPTKGLKEQKGWFKVLAYGFDANGNATNGGNPVEKYICDYRDESKNQVEILASWTGWQNLKELGKVNTIRFDFDGSDKNEYGLLTPAYLCIDQIYVNLIMMD